MRAHEFIESTPVSKPVSKPVLLEYNRAITIANQKTKEALANRVINGKREDKEYFARLVQNDTKLHNEMSRNPAAAEKLFITYPDNVAKNPLYPDDRNDPTKLNIDLDLLANIIMQQRFENRTYTKTKKYIPWILREYLKGNIERLEDIDGVDEVLSIYEDVKKRRGFPVTAKDITKLDYKTLRTIVRVYNPDDPEGYSQNMGDFDIIYGDINAWHDEHGVLHAEPSTDVVVVHPKDEAAGIYFGRYFGGFAEWCTAYVPPQTNRFDYYNKKGPLYIIIPREPDYDNEKYQLHGNGNEYKDEDDDDIDTNELLIDRFPEIRETVLELIPQLKDSVYFAPDKVLENIWSAIGELAYDYAITDSIFNTELNDNNYLEYQLEYAVRKGYFNPDIDPDRLEDIQNGDVTPDWDDIDQDKLSDDPEMDYLEYNYELGSMIRSYDIFRKSSAREIRGYASDYSNENDDSPLVNKLDDVYSYALESDSDFKNQEDLILYTKNNIDILNVSLDHDNTTAYLKRNGWIEHTQYGNYVLYRKR